MAVRETVSVRKAVVGGPQAGVQLLHLEEQLLLSSALRMQALLQTELQTHFHTRTPAPTARMLGFACWQCCRRARRSSLCCTCCCAVTLGMRWI